MLWDWLQSLCPRSGFEPLGCSYPLFQCLQSKTLCAMFHLSRCRHVCSLLERLRTASILKNGDLEIAYVCRCVLLTKPTIVPNYVKVKAKEKNLAFSPLNTSASPSSSLPYICPRFVLGLPAHPCSLLKPCFLARVKLFITSLKLVHQLS